MLVESAAVASTIDALGLAIRGVDVDIEKSTPGVRKFPELYTHATVAPTATAAVGVKLCMAITVPLLTGCET